MTAGTIRGARRIPVLFVAAAAMGVAMLALVLGGGATSVRAAGAEVNVGDGGLRYTPNHVAVNVGDTVTWTWVGGFHDVQSNNAAFSSGAPQRASGQKYTNTFTTPGTFWYYCSVHAKVEDANEQGLGAGKMVGSVTVLPKPAGAPGQAAGTPSATASATATATATATPTVSTPAATATATATPAVTPVAPKTGSAGLVSTGNGTGIAILWTAALISMIAGARALGRRTR